MADEGTGPQAPTPGPLSATAAFVKAFGQSLDQDFAFWSSPATNDIRGVLYPLWRSASEEIRLAPTAPVEASGSELGFTARHDLGCAQNAIPPQACDCSIRIFKAPPVDARLNQACQSMLDDYQTSEEHHPDHILVRRADFELMASALRPQPSGETRDAVARLDTACRLMHDGRTELGAISDVYGTSMNRRDLFCRDLRTLLSARPLTLGSQHSGGERGRPEFADAVDQFISDAIENGSVDVIDGAVAWNRPGLVRTLRESLKNSCYEIVEASK